MEPAMSLTNIGWRPISSLKMHGTSKFHDTTVCPSSVAGDMAPKLVQPVGMKEHASDLAAARSSASSPSDSARPRSSSADSGLSSLPCLNRAFAAFATSRPPSLRFARRESALTSASVLPPAARPACKPKSKRFLARIITWSSPGSA